MKTSKIVSRGFNMTIDYLKDFNDGDAILASETNANNHYLLNQIDERARALQTYLENQVSLLKGSFVLPGFIMGLPYDAVPTGYLRCDGSSCLIEDYPELHAAIGNTYGSVDDYHFNLPDFQGVFFRGAGGEKSASLGVLQEAAVPNIKGSVGGCSDPNTSGAFYQSGNGVFGGQGAGAPRHSTYMDASRLSSVYSNEVKDDVRPDNYSLVWVIKY